MVMMPSIAPRSSTTMASCWRSSRSCRSASETRSVSGRNRPVPGQRRPPGRPASTRSRRCTTPITSSRPAGPTTGAREWPPSISIRSASRGLGAGRQGEHVAARHQDLPQDPVGDLEGAADDGPLLGGEVLLRGDHVADLLGGDLLALRLRVAAGQPDHQVGGDAEQPHRRPGDHRQDVQRAGHQQRPALGALHRDPLRRQLADHQRDEGQHDRDQHDRGGLGGRAEEAERLDQRLRTATPRRPPRPGSRPA